MNLDKLKELVTAAAWHEDPQTKGTIGEFLNECNDEQLNAEFCLEMQDLLLKSGCLTRAVLSTAPYTNGKKHFVLLTCQNIETNGEFKQYEIDLTARQFGIKEEMPLFTQVN